MAERESDTAAYADALQILDRVSKVECGYSPLIVVQESIGAVIPSSAPCQVVCLRKQNMLLDPANCTAVDGSFCPAGKAYEFDPDVSDAVKTPVDFSK